MTIVRLGGPWSESRLGWAQFWTVYGGVDPVFYTRWYDCATGTLDLAVVIRDRFTGQWSYSRGNPWNIPKRQGPCRSKEWAQALCDYGGPTYPVVQTTNPMPNPVRTAIVGLAIAATAVAIAVTLLATA